MDLGALRGRVLAANIVAFGVPVTITRPAPDHAPVVTAGVWLTAKQDETLPYGHDLASRNPRRVLAIQTSAVATIPRNTFIDAPAAPGGSLVVRWRVDSVDETHSDHYRLALSKVS